MITSTNQMASVFRKVAVLTKYFEAILSIFSVFNIQKEFDTSDKTSSYPSHPLTNWKIKLIF